MKKNRSYKVCPYCGNRATKIIHLQNEPSQAVGCQECGGKYAMYVPNADVLNKLANFIEQHTDLPFDMYEPEQCICGFACILHGLNPIRNDAHRRVEDILGLSQRDADHLFFSTPNIEGKHVSYEEVTREMAVKTIRNLAITGRVVFGDPT